MEHYDVIVIGAGHAGIEAANISEKYGLKTALITKNYSDLGKLSCNPSIGGVGKTHIASEVDILGGCLLYTSPSPRDLSTSRMPSSA